MSFPEPGSDAIPEDRVLKDLSTAPSSLEPTLATTPEPTKQRIPSEYIRVNLYRESHASKIWRVAQDFLNRQVSQMLLL